MQVQLNLVISVILEAVKSETFIKGTIDRAQDERANALAYHETAGDEGVHERKLMRGIYTSLDKLKTHIVDYLEDSGSYVGDNVIKTLVNEDTDSIIIILEVNRRFNPAMTDSLARLCSKFIEDNTLVYWWGAIGSQSQVQFYTALVNEDIANINKAFTKRSGKTPVIPYTSRIRIEGSSIELAVGEKDTITYTIDEGCINDVDIQFSGSAAKVHRSNKDFVVEGIHPGICHAVLYSVHDETVYAKVDIVVHSNDGYYPDTHHHVRHI